MTKTCTMGNSPWSCFLSSSPGTTYAEGHRQLEWTHRGWPKWWENKWAVKLQCAEKALGGIGEMSAEIISLVGRVRSEFPLWGNRIKQGWIESNCKKTLLRSKSNNSCVENMIQYKKDESGDQNRSGSWTQLLSLCSWGTLLTQAESWWDLTSQYIK